MHMFLSNGAPLNHFWWQVEEGNERVSDLGTDFSALDARGDREAAEKAKSTQLPPVNKYVQDRVFHHLHDVKVCKDYSF